MSVEVAEDTAVVDDERSISAGAETRRETSSTAVARPKDPEVVQVAKRRKYSTEYKLKILAEVENNPKQTGIILRREGLYSSNITNWRRWKNQMNKNGTSSPNKQLHNEVAKLQRENKRLKLKLQKAEGLIELQKKTSEMLSLMSKNRVEEN